MQHRYFTVAQANELVPRLEGAFGLILRLRAQLHSLARHFERLGKPLSMVVSAESSEAPESRDTSSDASWPDVNRDALDEDHSAANDEDDASETLDDSPELARLRGQARALLETLNEQLEAVESLGVEVKDIDTGLCDFIARREGRDILLCWRLGEKQVQFWHEVHSGFAGRKPIDDTLLRVFH